MTVTGVLIEPFYAQIKTPVTVIHSTADNLVPYENANFVMERLHSEAKLIKLEGVSHPVQMNQPELLVNHILTPNAIGLQ